jgi:hypothetical protein
MKLTVKTFAQNKKGHAVHVEIVAASRAFAQCNQKSGDHKRENPDAEYGSHGFIGGGD